MRDVSRDSDALLFALVTHQPLISRIFARAMRCETINAVDSCYALLSRSDSAKYIYIGQYQAPHVRSNIVQMLSHRLVTYINLLVIPSAKVKRQSPRRGEIAAPDSTLPWVDFFFGFHDLWEHARPHLCNLCRLAPLISASIYRRSLIDLKPGKPVHVYREFLCRTLNA